MPQFFQSLATAPNPCDCLRFISPAQVSRGLPRWPRSVRRRSLGEFRPIDSQCRFMIVFVIAFMQIASVVQLRRPYPLLSSGRRGSNIPSQRCSRQVLLSRVHQLRSKPFEAVRNRSKPFETISLKVRLLPQA